MLLKLLGPEIESGTHLWSAPRRRHVCSAASTLVRIGCRRRRSHGAKPLRARACLGSGCAQHRTRPAHHAVRVYRGGGARAPTARSVRRAQPPPPQPARHLHPARPRLGRLYPARWSRSTPSPPPPAPPSLKPPSLRARLPLER
eukprot:scaffold18997_cov101-Isochrysis_galbana.AAC.2